MDGAGRLLRDALERAARMPRGRVMLVLHLSRIPAPAPRAYHRRIARAMLQDTAQRYDGQLFPLANGDLAMLCRSAGEGAATPAAGERGMIAEPARLPELLARLFRVDMPDPARLVSLWRLDTSLAAAMEYVDTPEPAYPEAPGLEDRGRGEMPGRTASVDAIAILAGESDLEPIMRRQTAVLLGGLRGLRPIFREVTFSIVELEARLSARESADATGQATADPFLFRHLARRLDARMLDAARGHLGAGTPLDALGKAMPMHLNLTVGGVLSGGFARFAAARFAASPGAGAHAHRPGVEIPMIEACVDGAAFVRARAAVAEAGMAFVLDGVSHLALMQTRPAAMAPDLLKLDWSPRMADLAPADREALKAAVAAFGAGRIVLHRAETEASLRWGLAHGIRRFQGRHVDAMLGAARILECVLSGGCSLGQCIGREAAVAPPHRAGCGNIALLEAGPAGRPVPLPA